MPIPLICAPAILEKIEQRHEVKLQEVKQAFCNSTFIYLEDDREEHKTEPATLWFVAPTDKGRLLKVIFVERNGNLYLKSAFTANESVQRIYAELSNQERT